MFIHIGKFPALLLISWPYNWPNFGNRNFFSFFVYIGKRLGLEIDLGGQFFRRQCLKLFGNRKILFQSAILLIFCPFLTACLGRPIGPLLQIGNFRFKRNFFIISAKFWD